MSMNVCHMLLGRPWQFDKKAMHDVYANTYTLTKDGVRHKLKSLSKNDEKVCKNTSKYLINGVKEPIKEGEDEDYDFLMHVVAMLIVF